MLKFFKKKISGHLPQVKKNNTTTTYELPLGSPRGKDGKCTYDTSEEQISTMGTVLKGPSMF